MIGKNETKNHDWNLSEQLEGDIHLQLVFEGKRRTNIFAVQQKIL